MFKSVASSVAIALIAAVVPFAAGCTAEAHIGTGPATPPPPPPAAPAPPPVVAKPAPAPAPAPAPVAPKVTQSGGKIALPGNIVYEFGKATIKPESEPTLQALKDFMDQNKQFTLIRIEGHTDNQGPKDLNQKLSEDRALAVVTWLVGHGVDKAHLLAVGFGDSKPIADNATPAGQEQNRRTEFHMAEIEGKPLAGRDETGGGKVAAGQVWPRTTNATPAPTPAPAAATPGATPAKKP